MNAPLIFVWIGEKLPSYAYDSLRFCNNKNPSRKIFLLTNALNCASVAGLVTVANVDEDKINKFYSTTSEMQFEGNLWINASLRFFMLEDLCKSLEIHKFYHAELDNAVFNLDGLDEKLDQSGNGIFVPRDASDRAIASLIYCNQTESLNELTGLYSSAAPPKHDMDALAMCSREYPGHCFSLPTESYKENSDSWRILDPDFLGGLFDAAAIGQYLLGVDPIHRQFQPCRNGFVNENCNVDLGSVEFIAKDAKVFIRFPSSKTELQFYNIHLHSKNFSKFNELVENGKILQRLNAGKKSIISKPEMMFIGPIICAAHKLIVSIKQLLEKMRKGAFSYD